MSKTLVDSGSEWDDHSNSNYGRELFIPSDRAKRQQYMTEHDEDYAHFEENRPRQGPGHIE